MKNVSDTVTSDESALSTKIAIKKRKARRWVGVEERRRESNGWSGGRLSLWRFRDTTDHAAHTHDSLRMRNHLVVF